MCGRKGVGWAVPGHSGRNASLERPPQRLSILHPAAPTGGTRQPSGPTRRRDREGNGAVRGHRERAARGTVPAVHSLPSARCKEPALTSD